MPFTILPGRERHVKGTRSATIKHVRHDRGMFSGPAREEDTYYSVSGIDTLRPNVEFCPPNVLTLEEARAVALRWLDNLPTPIGDVR